MLDASTRQIEGGAQVADNVNLGLLGVLRGRKALVELWRHNSSVEGIAICGTHILNSTSANLYNRNVLLNASWGGWFDWVEINDWYYLANGTTFIRTDGTNVYNVGITSPDSAPTVATGAAGNLTGDYYYRYTFIDNNGFESNASVASALVQPSSEKVELSVIDAGASADDVAQRKIYRTKAGGTTYYLLTTIADNTTTTYSDDVTDANLGTTTYPTDHNKPDTDFTNISLVRDRWFASKTDSRRLYYSKPFPNERAQPSTYYLDFPSYIKGHAPIGGSLLVICQDRPYVLAGLDDVNTFNYRLIRGKAIHVKSGRVTAEFDRGVLTQGGEGLFYVDDVMMKFVSQNIRTHLTAPSSTAVGTSTPDIFFLIPSESSLSGEIGTVITFSQGDTTGTFSSEVGIVTSIEGDDTYTFTSEFGIITGVGTAGAGASMLVADKRHGTLEFSYDTEKLYTLTYSNRDRNLYGGTNLGVSSFSGNREKFTWQMGDSYLGHPHVVKWLHEVILGYLKGTVICEVYVDGATTAAYTNENTIYANNTTIQADNTAIGANGQIIYDGRVQLQIPGDIHGVTFSLKLTIVGELHAPVTFKYFLGGTT
jgi:hypothetical protein